MKPLIVFSLLLLACALPSLSGQDLSLEHHLGNYVLLEAEPAGNDGFFLICEKKSAADLVVKNLAKEKAIFKFDANLKQVWQEPLALKGITGYDATVFAYTDPAGQHSADYFFGSGQFVQVRQDGAVHEKETGISKKEGNKTAAAFVDENGLNILTITGDETFPTGSMNWYTFSHSDLSLTKLSISLPLPPDVDEDNESGWRLNQATEDGLFFYYVSYKNEPKDINRPILSCLVVQVSPEGKTGRIVTIDTGLDQYKAIPVSYQQDSYPDAAIFSPRLWEAHTYTTPNSRFVQTSYTPTDNSFMGVRIDAKNGRIYTVAALNPQIEVDKKKGTVKSDGRGWALPVKSLQLIISDLQGNQIASATLDHTPVKLAPTDNYGYEANRIELIPLPGDEGVICRFVNNGTGALWVVNPMGEVVKDARVKPYAIKVAMGKVYYDIFSAPQYASLTALENSPCLAKESSGAARLFEGLDDKTKRETSFVAGENRDLLIVPESAGKKLKFYSFTKN